MNNRVDAPLEVLCIENDEASLVLLRALFKLRPHLELHLARDGVEATQLAAGLKPALVLVAGQLPDCGGGELVALLRRRYGWGSVPVVAMSRRSRLHNDSVFRDVWDTPLDARLALSFLDRWLPPPNRAPDSRTPAGVQLLPR